MATSTPVRLDTAATPRVPSTVTIKLVLQCLGRSDASDLVACPISGCRTAAFKYDLRRFACHGCRASGDAIELARRMGVGADAEAFVRALVVTGDRCPRVLWTGLHRALEHRMALRPVEETRRAREERVGSIPRAYGARSS